MLDGFVGPPSPKGVRAPGFRLREAQSNGSEFQISKCRAISQPWEEALGRAFLENANAAKLSRLLRTNTLTNHSNCSPARFPMLEMERCLWNSCDLDDVD